MHLTLQGVRTVNMANGFHPFELLNISPHLITGKLHTEEKTKTRGVLYVERIYCKSAFEMYTGRILH